MSPIPNDTLELDADGREGLVLDVALPVLTARGRSVRVVGFRPSMGVSGLSAREVARLRTLGLATGAKATGVFEGANDFRMGFPAEGSLNVATAKGVEADLGGHPLAPVVSDLSVAAFGLPGGRSLTHTLRGFTHVRGATSHGYFGRTLRALGREFRLNLATTTGALGFEPQGEGEVRIDAVRGLGIASKPVDWKNRGEVKNIHIVLGGVRPKLDQFERIEAGLKETLWEARRAEPVIHRQVTQGVDFGAFLQVDVECEQGGATFLEMVSRQTAPLPLARRMVKKALAFSEGAATFDEATGLMALSAAVAAGAEFTMSVVPSDRVSSALRILRELNTVIEESEAPGLVVLTAKP